MLNKDNAVCLKAIDYSETSQIVTFFTHNLGKISAIAKGSKRPKSAFQGPIELFSHGPIVFSASNREKLAVLTEFDQQTAFKGLTTDFFKLNCALFATELVERFTDKYIPHPMLFKSFLEFLSNVSESENHTAGCKNSLILLILFQLTLLQQAGLTPVINTCVNCKTKYNDNWKDCYFSGKGNGLICRDCETGFPDRIRVNNSAAAVLANLKTIADAKETQIKQIETVLIYYITELLGQSPKMAKYFVK